MGTSLVRWIFKGCPHCGGDLAYECGLDGWVWNCLLCAREFYPIPPLNPEPDDIESITIEDNESIVS